MKTTLLLIMLILLSSALVAQAPPQPYSLPVTVVAQKWFGTSAPGVLPGGVNGTLGNLPGDLYTNTATGDQYVCTAAQGTVAPACTSVADSAWKLIGTVTTVTSVALAGTANQIVAAGTCTITTTGTCTFSIPSGLVLPGTINGLTITMTTGTLTIAAAKVLTVNKSVTLDGTDGVTITFPASNAAVATLGLTNTFTGRQDATGAASTAPARTGVFGSIPGTCAVGDLYFATDKTAGQNLYECQSTNTWTQQLNSAGSSFGFAPAITSTTLSVTSGTIGFTGSAPYSIGSAALANGTVSSGSSAVSGVLFVTNTGALVLQVPNSLNVSGWGTTTNITVQSVATPALPTAATGGTGFPIATMTLTSNGSTIAFSALTDTRAAIQSFSIVSGTGLACTSASGLETCAIDTAVVPQLGGNNAYTGIQDARSATNTYPAKTAASDPGTCTVGEQYFNTATGATKNCTATNTWTSTVLAATSTTITQALFATSTEGTGGYRAIAAADLPAVNFATPGSSHTLANSADIFVCTTTCTITVPVPSAGLQYCVMNDDNVSTVITMSAIGSSARYENTARTAYGTAGTGTFVSGGAAGDFACLLGRDSTHYLTVSFKGTWVAN